MGPARRKSLLFAVFVFVAMIPMGFLHEKTVSLSPLTTTVDLLHETDRYNESQQANQTEGNSNKNNRHSLANVVNKSYHKKWTKLEEFDCGEAINGRETKDNDLPGWVLRYFDWHREMRSRFPKLSLIKNYQSRVLIRACPYKCGGLNDRLGQLPWDLYIANQTGRVLLYQWHLPAALEEFLVPAGPIDWRVPKGVEELKNLKNLWNLHTRILGNDHADTPTLNADLQDAINMKGRKVLAYRFLGHIREPLLEQKLRELGESDKIHQPPHFGNIFRAFFKPSPAVEAALEEAKREVGILGRNYSAVHCRVRHPKNVPRGEIMLGANGKGPADRDGLIFTGETKDSAVRVATHATQCLKHLLLNDTDTKEPVYFFADESKLVSHFVRDLRQQDTVGLNEVDREAQRVVLSTTVVARNQTYPNMHIDRQLDHPLEMYIAVFVDFFLAVGARCMAFGIGNFAYFATKVSGTACRIMYQKERWGEQKQLTDICRKTDY